MFVYDIVIIHLTNESWGVLSISSSSGVWWIHLTIQKILTAVNSSQQHSDKTNGRTTIDLVGRELWQWKFMVGWGFWHFSVRNPWISPVTPTRFTSTDLSLRPTPGHHHNTTMIYVWYWWTIKMYFDTIILIRLSEMILCLKYHILLYL